MPDLDPAQMDLAIAMEILETGLLDDKHTTKFCQHIAKYHASVLPRALRAMVATGASVSNVDHLPEDPWLRGECLALLQELQAH